MSKITYSIRIVDEDGNGVEGLPVLALYATTNETKRTDEDGWVEFTNSSFLWDHLTPTIFIDGEEMGEYIFEDGDTMSFTRPR